MKRKSVFIILKIKREDKICLLYMKILYGIKAKVTGFTLFVKMKFDSKRKDRFKMWDK